MRNGLVLVARRRSFEKGGWNRGLEIHVHARRVGMYSSSFLSRWSAPARSTTLQREYLVRGVLTCKIHFGI